MTLDDMHARLIEIARYVAALRCEVGCPNESRPARCGCARGKAIAGFDALSQRITDDRVALLHAQEPRRLAVAHALGRGAGR